jgi:hypothetical protein
VRAEHHRRHLLASAAHADDVADRVDGHREAEVAHPLNEQVAPGAVLVAEREPAIAAAGQRPDAVEGFEPAEQAVALMRGMFKFDFIVFPLHVTSKLSI